MNPLKLIKEATRLKNDPSAVIQLAKNALAAKLQAEEKAAQKRLFWTLSTAIQVRSISDTMHEVKIGISQYCYDEPKKPITVTPLQMWIKAAIEEDESLSPIISMLGDIDPKIDEIATTVEETLEQNKILIRLAKNGNLSFSVLDSRDNIVAAHVNLETLIDLCQNLRNQSPNE